MDSGAGAGHGRISVGTIPGRAYSIAAQGKTCLDDGFPGKKLVGFADPGVQDGGIAGIETAPF